MEIGGCRAFEWRSRRFFARCNFAILKTRENKKKRRARLTEKRERYLLGRGLNGRKGHTREDARKGIQPAFADGTK
jgi:hypothetical protein